MLPVPLRPASPRLEDVYKRQGIEQTEDQKTVFAQLMQIENERNTQFLQAKNNRKRAEQIKDELKESEETIQKIRGTISSIQEEIAKLTGNRETAEKQISDDIKSACNLITGALITSNIITSNIITCNIITCNQSTLTGDTDVNTCLLYTSLYMQKWK